MATSLLADFLLQPAAAWINRGIDQSAEATAMCGRLDGASLAVNFTALPLPLRVLIEIWDGQIEVEHDPNAEADVEISGSAIELGRLMAIGDEASIRDGSVQITGDAELADQFRLLLRLARPDFEHEIAGIVGAETASRFAATARNFQQRTTNVSNDAVDRISAWLRNDDQLPSATQIETFFNGVDTFGNDVARLEARLASIRQSRTS
jgi:ubiquinone biosynthesis protein UbiJ